MELTADNVNAVASRALFRDDEITDLRTPPDGAVIVDGIVSKYAFHPERLAAERGNIAALLDGLDESFKSTGGGGMSFLNACMTKDGEHWGEHPTMGMLFALGIGSGLCSYTLPREMWPVLPGGVPYITIDAGALEAA